MRKLLLACEAARARLVFADNLYLYGPVNGTSTDDLPVVPYGPKPRARVAATRLWQEAHRAGRVKVMAVRSPDFYGPGVEQSVLGGASFVGGLARFSGDPAVGTIRSGDVAGAGTARFPLLGWWISRAER